MNFKELYLIEAKETSAALLDLGIGTDLQHDHKLSDSQAETSLFQRKQKATKCSDVPDISWKLVSDSRELWTKGKK